MEQSCRLNGGSISSLARWAGPLVIAAVSLAMLVWQWRSWPDVLVDFGRELYVAWQLAEGKVLYTDIAYFNGPLSPYLNSLWFRLFGVSLMTLAVCNMVIVVGLIVLLYRVLLDIADRVSATAACVTFATIFGFGNLLAISNYNYICPYSHEMTHGVVLAMVSIWCVSMYHRRGRIIYVAGAGLALGLAFLTKAEVFLAGAAAVCVALLLTIWSERLAGGRLIRLSGIFVGLVMLPVIIAFGLLCMVMPADRALLGTMGTWPWVGNKEVTSLVFYRRSMGLDYPLVNVKKMLLWAGWYMAVFVPAGLLRMAPRKKGPYRIVVAAVCFAVAAGMLRLNWSDIPWFDVARPLPLLMLVLAVDSFVVFVKQRRKNQLRGRLIVQLCMSIFALGLLGRIILYTRVHHYGFVLAMPATLLAVVVMTYRVPAWLNQRGGYGGIFRAFGLVMLLACILAHLRIMSLCLSKKTYTVSSGADTILTDRRGQAVNTLLEQIEQQVKLDETLAVLPEGVMVNYLCQRVNPTPYINFMPPELIMFREDKMLASFQEHRPDYIALVHKNATEYGFDFFGRDYGRELFGWVTNNYKPVYQIGALALQDKCFGILLMQAKKSQ